MNINIRNQKWLYFETVTNARFDKNSEFGNILLARLLKSKQNTMQITTRVLHLLTRKAMYPVRSQGKDS